MCEGSYSSSLCFGSYVDSWCCAHSIWDHPHSVPLYICQCVPRDVHFHIPMCAVQKGKNDFLSQYVIQHQLFTAANAFLKFFHQIQEEYYRLFKNIPCCYQCLRWTLSNEHVTAALSCNWHACKTDLDHCRLTGTSQWLTSKEGKLQYIYFFN